jgi:hypothetical protein
MSDSEPDYGEEQRETLLRILARVAAGAPLQAAASHEGGDVKMVLEIALRDCAFARALLVAQQERAHWEGRDLLTAVERVDAACSELAGAVG